MLSLLRVPLCVGLVCLLALPPLLPCRAPAAPTRAEAAPEALPEGLLEAVLAASGQPFQADGGVYRAHTGGREVSVGPGGLEARAAGLPVYLEQKVIAPGTAEGWFGFPVALSGDTALVGTPGDTIGANTNQGSAFVFVWDGTTWSLQARLTAADGATEDQFGVSVALSGDTALVGAYRDDVGANADQGSAYIFARKGTTWSQTAQLIASDGAADDWFGCSVALSANRLLVGARLDDTGANADQGSAYFYTSSFRVYLPLAFRN
jgi:hypothetical protein